MRAWKNMGLTLWKLYLALNNFFLRQILEPKPPILVNSDDGDKACKELKMLKVVKCQKIKLYKI